MKALRVLGVACACATLLAAAPPHTTIYGFTTITSDKEFALEDRFLDVPTAAGALEHAAVLASRPHYAGSDGDYKLAYYVRDRFKEYGFDTSVETLTARVDTPKKLALELVPTGTRPGKPATVKPPAHIALFNRRRRSDGLPPGMAPPAALSAPTNGFDLRELADPSDPDTANPAVGLPFLAGSADGDVTAPLVYAGHGTAADYAALSAHGIDVTGTVVLMRYGAEARGDLVRRAEARGVRAAILYDDPADDGPGRGGAYPNGPWRPLNSVQRGSLGLGISIPVLPISANNARLLLASLHGPSAPAPWRGGLPVAYPFARGPATAHVIVELNHRTTTLWNTIGILHGTLPGQQLVIGAHRDAWVYGLGSSGGGVVTLLETARGLGNLALTGWQPGRTIVLAAWDGEELGQYGSLAYIRRHGDELNTGSVAYLNTEPSVTGTVFGADAVAAIAATIADATHVVPDPAQPGNTIYERWAFRTHGVLPPVILPAGGSDRDAFLFGAGTPSANAGFSGPFGPYHSSYDTLQYARTVSDPEFALHRAAAQIYGVAALRLANADVVPYHFSAYVAPMRSASRSLAAVARLHKLTFDQRGLERSIAGFAASAARSDLATARVSDAQVPENQLEAARILDLAVYGVESNGTISFPDINRALRDGDQAAADLAVARARTTLDHAASLIH
jgi:N-acetylated-alpha-linked acidic dipeptidase